MEVALAYRLYVSYSPTTKPMSFVLPELNDALIKAKAVFAHGFQVDYLELDDGSRLGAEEIKKLIQERHAVLAWWRRLY
jgi:hypothetical protein